MATECVSEFGTLMGMTDVKCTRLLKKANRDAAARIISQCLKDATDANACYTEAQDKMSSVEAVDISVMKGTSTIKLKTEKKSFIKDCIQGIKLDKEDNYVVTDADKTACKEDAKAEYPLPPEDTTVESSMKACINIKGITEADCEGKIKPAVKTAYGADTVTIEDKGTDGDKVKCCIKVKCKDSDHCADVNEGMESDSNMNCDADEIADGVKCAGVEMQKISRRRLTRELLAEDAIDTDPPLVEVTKKPDPDPPVVDPKKPGYGTGLVLLWILGIFM